MAMLKVKKAWVGYEFRQGAYVLALVFELRDTAFDWQENAPDTRKVKAVSLVTDEEVK